MIRSLVEKYRLGMITDDHFVVGSLHMVDPANPGLVLSSLPDKVLPRQTVMLPIAVNAGVGRSVG